MIDVRQILSPSFFIVVDRGTSMEYYSFEEAQIIKEKLKELIP